MDGVILYATACQKGSYYFLAVHQFVVLVISLLSRVIRPVCVLLLLLSDLLPLAVRVHCTNVKHGLIKVHDTPAITVLRNKCRFPIAQSFL